MKRRSFAAVCATLFAGCGGGGGTTPPGAPMPPSSPVTPAAVAVLVPTSFAIGSATTTSSEGRRPSYVGAGAKSVTVALTSVNGAAPSAAASATTAVVPAACPCTVAGPLVPAGSDVFTITTYDAANGGGNAIATATVAVTVASATPATAVTLAGIPKTLTLASPPPAAAGTAFATPAPLTLRVSDADGATITGTYATPVTVSQTDASGVQGSQLAVNGGTGANSVTVKASTDAIALSYGGLAIAPSTITAAATGVTSANAVFAPTLSPITYSGPTSGAAPLVELVASTGTGSSQTFTVSETGWTNAPYNRTLSASTTGCGSIGTLTSSTGTSFTLTAAASPVAGTCTIKVSDSAGQSLSINAAYTSSTVNLQ